MSKEGIRETVDLAINSLVERLKNELGIDIESIFIAGSYVTGNISTQCPNVNLYVISKSNKSNELFLPLGKIFYEIKKDFEDKINVVADLKPYRFAYYKPVKNRVTLTIRLNLFDMKDKDKKFMVPDYVLRGWLNSEKVLYGQDVLKDLPIKVEVSPEIINQKRFVLLTIMQQLKHIPFTYDWSKEPELLFHESYEFSKYLLSEGLLLKMEKSEIEAGLDVQIYDEKEKFVNFYLEKYGPEASDLAKRVMEAREHYLEWKDDVEKAKQMYSIAWRIYGIVWRTLLEKIQPPKQS
jgi:hypothetical protein